MDPVVKLFEVSLRDGLQNEAVVVDTSTKLQVLDRLIRAGFQDIEVTSFVRPRFVPQLADAAELVSKLPKDTDVRFWALIPNAIGLDRALDAGIEHIATFMSASDTHNKKNVNRTTKESLSALKKVMATASSEGLGSRAYISTVFGCPYEGDVPIEVSLRLAQEFLEAGAQQIVLGDTTGMAHPEQVKGTIRSFVEAGISLDAIGLHFHDTKGTALVNVYAAWQEGVRSFDGSIAGVGGCPYAPGAAGNVSSEDLVYLFESFGIHTGINLQNACEGGELLQTVLGRSLPGRYFRYWLAQSNRESQSA